MIRDDPFMWGLGVVVTLLTALLLLQLKPDPIRAEDAITLAEVDRRAETRHRELLIRIEALRRQSLLLHGKKYVEENDGR